MLALELRRFLPSDVSPGGSCSFLTFLKFQTPTPSLVAHSELYAKDAGLLARSIRPQLCGDLQGVGGECVS